MSSDRGYVHGSATGTLLASSTTIGRIQIPQGVHSGRVVAVLVGCRAANKASSVTAQIVVSYEFNGTTVNFTADDSLAPGVNAANVGAAWSIDDASDGDGVHLVLKLDLPAITLNGVAFVGGGEWFLVTN